MQEGVRYKESSVLKVSHYEGGVRYVDFFQEKCSIGTLKKCPLAT